MEKDLASMRAEMNLSREARPKRSAAEAQTGMDNVLKVYGQNTPTETLTGQPQQAALVDNDAMATMDEIFRKRASHQ